MNEIKKAFVEEMIAFVEKHRERIASAIEDVLRTKRVDGDIIEAAKEEVEAIATAAIECLRRKKRVDCFAYGFYIMKLLLLKWTFAVLDFSDAALFIRGLISSLLGANPTDEAVKAMRDAEFLRSLGGGEK